MRFSVLILTIKMNLKEVGYEGMDWNDMSLIGAICLRVQYNGRNFLTSRSSVQRRLGSRQSVINCHSHRLIFRRNSTAIARNIRAC